MQLLYNEDCIKKMEQLLLDGVIVDAIITDPPYNISKKNNFHTLKGRKGIDFGDWDKGFEQLKWLKSADKLLKSGGNLIIFNDWKNLGIIARFLEQFYNYKIKDVIRWIKNNPMPRNINRRYITDYEFAIWLVKPGSKWTFNKISSKYQRPEFSMGIVSGKEKLNHPTQKPLKLMENLVKIHTEENQVVLDPFMGSGTTIEACKNLNRGFIGIEINENYYKLSEKRIGFTKVKNPINYLGGKYKYIDEIKKYFPKQVKGVFYDVFFGSGEVSVNTAYRKTIAFEKNKDVYMIYKLFNDYDFKTLDREIKKIIQKYKLTISSDGHKYKKVLNKGLKEHNEIGYKKLREDYNKKNNPINLLILIMYSFNNQIRKNKSGGFNVPVGKSDYNTTVRQNLQAICDRFKIKKNLEVLNKDFFTYDIKKINGNDFLYFDPPYLITNATYNESKGWTEIEEKKLIKILKKLNEMKVRWCLTNVIKKGEKTNTILSKFIEESTVKHKIIETKYKNYRRKNNETIEVVVWNY